MKDITTQDIHDIAGLSQLSLTEKEVASYREDLSAVLGYFESLKEVNTEGVEGIGHITGMENVYRRDEAQPISEQERHAIMANVPAIEGDAIKVKNVL